jgi:hypothetical protein
MTEKSLVHKLNETYFNDELNEATKKLTPLRRFVLSIGLDFNKLTNKQMRKWSSTKRYKTYLKLYKLKKLADFTNKQKEVTENLEFFFENFICQDEEIINENDALSFLQVLEAYRLKVPTPRIYKLHVGGRGGNKDLTRPYHYKKLAQRKQELQQNVIKAVQSGAIVSDAPGTSIYSGLYKHSKHGTKSLGQNKVVIKRKISTPNSIRYHRKVNHL